MSRNSSSYRGSSSPSRKTSVSSVRIVGHRGAAALAPENTIAAFDAGLAAGVDDVEFDVQRTPGGLPIVIHDDTLDRTSSLRGAVSATAWPAIRDGAPEVPSLDE